MPSASAPAGAEANGDTPLLRLENIGKSFGPVQALTGISLDIPAGKVTALAGDNGAGTGRVNYPAAYPGVPGLGSPFVDYAPISSRRRCRTPSFSSAFFRR